MYNGPEHYLDKDAAAGRVMAHARLLLKLSRRFEAVAPAGLRHSAHVANYKLGTVIIHADNGAVAAKIRQLSQRLSDEVIGDVLVEIAFIGQESVEVPSDREPALNRRGA